MPRSIDSVFRLSCEANPDTSLLLAQWEYDQRLLEQALVTIGHLFPHYSQHDASHSRTILERVASLLGEESLTRLSSTDLWLLLEAAHLHDAGMVANHARKSSDLASEDFARHLRKLARDNDSELAAAAQRLLTETPRATPAEILEGNFDLLLVYAEFVRARHPQRAAEFVLDPLRHLSISSPRTLLPGRFWNLLGQVCRAHGENLNFALTLPHEETGLGGDLCHPRFVACMLRLGDLLDLDGGRFCPAVNAMAPRMPATSESHRLKHEGVDHLLVSPLRVSVTATYSNIDAYLEAERWFAWLRDELRDQLMSWDKIAPSADFGALPSLGEIEARLVGQIAVAPKSRPGFDVDRDKILELVRGANLYEGPHDAVREIVQNAIDATLFRLSYESQCAGTSVPESLDNLRERLKSLPIQVTVQKATTQPEDDEMARWIVTVKDHGIGLRVTDFSHLLRLGASSRNDDRRELAEWLPTWARPSGTFGIGFHSLFEYCHRVTLSTRHPADPDGLEATFEIRDTKTEPVVVVKRRLSSNKYPPPAGSVLEAEFDFPRVPSTVNLGGSGEARNLMREYDFVYDAEVPYSAARIRDTIADLARLSVCSIQLDGRSQSSLPPAERFLFDPVAGVELRLLDAALKSFRVSMLFRGAEVESRATMPLLSIESNLHSGDARNLLELSRNKLTRQGNRIAIDATESGLRSCVRVWLADPPSGLTTNQIGVLALYATLFDSNGISDARWREVHLATEPNLGLTLGTLADAQRIEIQIVPMSATERQPMQANREGENVQLIYSDADLDRDWFGPFLQRHFPRRVFLGRHTLTKGVMYEFSKSPPGEDVTDEGLRHDLLRVYPPLVGCRHTLLCPAKFGRLKMPKSLPGWWTSDTRFISGVIANPFIVTKENVTIRHADAYVWWLASKRNEPAAEIAESLIVFMRYVDQLVGPNWGVTKQYDLEAVVAGLRATFGLKS